MLRHSLKRLPRRTTPPAQGGVRALATAAEAHAPKKQGDISDAFVSLSGAKRDALPDRFRALKCDLIRGRERAIQDGWSRLLRELQRENDVIARQGSAVIPQVEYTDLERGVDGVKEEIRKRGAVVIRGVIPEREARAYKEEVEDYVRKNPSTRGKWCTCLTCIEVA